MFQSFNLDMHQMITKLFASQINRQFTQSQKQVNKSILCKNRFLYFPGSGYIIFVCLCVCVCVCVFVCMCVCVCFHHQTPCERSLRSRPKVEEVPQTSNNRKLLSLYSISKVITGAASQTDKM